MTHAPLDWIVFKIAERCNINCTYCYVYNLGDDSWKSRPKFVSDEVVTQLGARISEQCKKYGLSGFNVEFHGGEPLLIGKVRFRRILQRLKIEAGSVALRFHLQTNGLLLDEEWVQIFADWNVSFGVSLDGPPMVADIHRVDHRGLGTTERVAATLQALSPTKSFQATFGGALCVLMNPTLDPALLLDWYVERGIRRLDFLLPDGNYHRRPPVPFTASAYGDFFVRAFDYWIDMGPDAPEIRFFEYIVRGLAGEVTELDSFGGDLASICVVESDGSIGVSDVGRICPPLSVDQTSIFEAPLDTHAGIYELASLQELSSQCKRCKFRSTCKGGYLPHRYDGRSFQNPSYYCAALFRIMEHVLATLEARLAVVEN